MDSARQALRWTIPGWLFILFIFLFEGMRMLFGAPSALWLAVATDGRLLLGILAGGLPIGFVIYQIYFWVYWVVKFPEILGLGHPLDRSWPILKDVIDELDLKQMAGREWRKAPETATRETEFGPLRIRFKDRKVMENYRDNWLVVNFLWHKLIAENQLQSLENTAMTLHDIYHCLGTARYSVSLSFGFHTFATIVCNWPPSLQLSLWLPLLLNGGLTVIFFSAFHAARYDTLAAILQFKHDFITYYHRLSLKQGN